METLKTIWETQETQFGNPTIIRTFETQEKATEYYNETITDGELDYGEPFDFDNDYIGVKEIVLKEPILKTNINDYIAPLENIERETILQDQ